MNLIKCIMFKVIISKVLKSQYFLKTLILVFWTRQWGTCFCRVRCSGGSISLPISRCISLWTLHSVSLHSIVSRTFYFLAHILFFLHISFFCTLCFWSPNAHQPSSHCWFNTFFLHSPMLQHRTQCIAPLLVLLCTGLLVWSASSLAWIAETLILYPGRNISSSSLILVFITIVYPFIQKSDQTAWCQRKNNQGVRSSAKTTRKKPWECQQQTWELANVRHSLFSSVVDLLK